jgi:hypothetical protein
MVQEVCPKIICGKTIPKANLSKRYEKNDKLVQDFAKGLRKKIIPQYFHPYLLEGTDSLLIPCPTRKS